MKALKSMVVGAVLGLGTAQIAAAASDCQNVNIMKRFVEVPQSCAVDSCETWQSQAVLGPGHWHLEVDFANVVVGPWQPFGELLLFATVTDTFVASNGDRLYAHNAVSINLDSPVAAGIMYVRGGTGRFRNASGNLFIRVDNANGIAQVDGTLCGIRGLSVLE